MKRHGRYSKGMRPAPALKENDMKLQEFLEEYNLAPYDMEQFAHGASEVDDDMKLRGAGRVFVAALANMEDELARVGCEIG